MKKKNQQQQQHQHEKPSLTAYIRKYNAIMAPQNGTQQVAIVSATS